ILTRQRLIEQQTAFYEQVGKKYGLERGLQGGSSKHLEISELKACTAEANADTAYNIYKDLQEQAEALQSDYEAKKAYVDDLDLENAEINDLNYQNIILKNENEKLKNENFNLKEKLNWLIDKIKNLELFQEFKRLFEPQKTKKKSRDRER
ncbi:MAG: hypothetical protein RR436_07200, partial [Clostridia bacterium]